MTGTGKAYRLTEEQLGTFTCTESGGFTWCVLSVGAVEVIKFPLPLAVDTGEVEARMANIINQTGLVEYAARVVMD